MKVNSTDINLLHPKLKELCSKLFIECKKQGINLKVISTYRNAEYQNGLGKDVTKAGAFNSYHQWGLAFDIAALSDDGKSVINNWIPKNCDNWFKIGEIAESLGLEWGGHWTSIKDYGHFQLKIFNLVELKNGTAKSKDVFFNTVYDNYKKGI